MEISSVANNENQRSIDAILTGSGVVFFVVAVAIVFVVLTGPHVPVATKSSLAPEVKAEPVQRPVKGLQKNPIVLENGRYTWTLTPRATYQISARVLGRKRYSDWQASVVPLDLALGWGEMGDSSVDEWISWRQSNRWYHYSWNQESPINGSDIRDHSANVHIIPATENLSDAMRLVRKDQSILLEGLLVDINARNENDERWIKTSLTRQDSGGGACEVLYVERLILDGNAYE